MKIFITSMSTQPIEIVSYNYYKEYISSGFVDIEYVASETNLEFTGTLHAPHSDIAGLTLVELSEYIKSKLLEVFKT